MSATVSNATQAIVERTPEGRLLIRGTRVDLEVVAEAYRDGLSPEEIAYNYPSLSLAQAYAAIAWYLANPGLLEIDGAEEQPPATRTKSPVVDRLGRLAIRRDQRAP